MGQEIGCASWAQFLLKFVISTRRHLRHPATSKVQHLTDNMQAGVGSLPNAPCASAWRATSPSCKGVQFIPVEEPIQLRSTLN
jgi:hypothetical protein